MGILSGSKPIVRARSVIEKNNFLFRKVRQVRTRRKVQPNRFLDRPDFVNVFNLKNQS
jgi:hypothetical protein